MSLNDSVHVGNGHVTLTPLRNGLMESRNGALHIQRMNADANRLAHLVHARGLQRGDVAALMMENCPEYISSWMALAKLGVTAALINPNIRDAALAHAIEATDCKLLLVGGECVANLAESSVDVTGIPVLVMRDRCPGQLAVFGFLESVFNQDGGTRQDHLHYLRHTLATELAEVSVQWQEAGVPP